MLWVRRGLRLRMNEPVRIQIIGAPVACAEGIKETWRDLGLYLAGRLREQYGAAIEVAYYDLFDPACPPLPPNARLPLVIVDGDLLTNGDKLSMPAIRRRLEISGVLSVDL